MRRKFLIFVFLALSFFLVSTSYILARDGGPAADDPDINIQKRGLVPASFNPGILPHPENTDTKQPRLGSVFSPSFGTFYQVRDYNGQGLDASNLNSPGAATIIPISGGEVLAPLSGYPIGGGFYYTVLYASDSDIVIHAGTEDSVAIGYTIHFLNFIVNPELKRMYDENEARGRKQLLAIPCRQRLGETTNEVTVSIRDSGSFMDTRFEDWWSQSPTADCNGSPGFIDMGKTPLTDIKEYSLTEVPCTDTTDQEFHSLRPYPANPCIKNAPDTTMMCSNDLVVVKTVTPNSAYETSCTPHAPGQAYTCTYTDVPLGVDVSINLSGAELPIMGNTEDVPNATWTSVNTNANNLTPAQRMNNYVSWYLNGVLNRAEEDFSVSNIKPEDFPKYLINYSGPLAKLLPFATQTINRLVSINNADQTQRGNLTPDGGGYVLPSEKNQRHNQVVGCPLGTTDKVTGTIPCYLFTLQAFIDNSTQLGLTGSGVVETFFTINDILRRLAAFKANPPPLETAYESFNEYWRVYQTWKGELCPRVPIPGLSWLYGCIDLKLNFMSALFNNIPSSTTEDRVGTFGANNPAAPVVGQAGACRTSGAPCTTTCVNGRTFSDSCPGGGSFASCSAWAVEACRTVGSVPSGSVNTSSASGVTFTPSTGTNYQHNLYFAHMQENIELASKLQSTFKPEGEQSGHLTNTPPDIKAGCVIQEARTNPGDNLYGDTNRSVNANGVPDAQIAGTVNFKATYTCTYSPVTSNGIIIGGYGVTCSKAIASLAMFTQTPEAESNWDTLVGGTMAVFKRFFPKTGEGTPLKEIKEIPAYTQATYNGSGTGNVAAGSTATAGDGAASTKANVYFPYIGGIKDYFLEGIQTALRPKGMGNGTLVGAPSSGDDAANNLQCTGLTNSIDYTDRNVGVKSISDIISSLRVINPGGFTQSQITNIQNSMNIATSGTIRYQTIIDQSLALGFNPAFVMAIWLEESAGSTLDAYDWGCGAAGKNDFQGQLSCFLGLPAYWNNNKSLFSCGINSDGSIDFLHFMLFFSEGTCNTITSQENKFCSHKTFPARFSAFYNLVKR